MSIRRARSSRRITSAAAALVAVAAGLALALHWDVLPLEPAGQTAPTTTATVAYVIDGDTIAVTVPGETGDPQRVRLLGINTPEVAHGDDGHTQCGGAEATAALEKILPEGQSVQLVSDPRADDTDRWGRLLRYVETDTEGDIAESLVTAGYAYAWTPDSAPEPQRYSAYRDSTTTARDAGAGAWSTCPDLDQSR